MPTSKKEPIFCTECGKESFPDSAYCVNCGAKLVRPGQATNKNPNKELYEVTLENMSSNISYVTFMVAKFVVKTPIVSLGPRLPNTHDSEFIEAIVILSGALMSEYDVTDEVKEKILDDIGTDLNIDQVRWATLESPALNDKGWNAVYSEGKWYMWPMSDLTVKTLITVNYTDANSAPSRNIVTGEIYNKDNLNHDKTSEAVWATICIVATIIFFIILFINNT